MFAMFSSGEILINILGGDQARAQVCIVVPFVKTGRRRSGPRAGVHRCAVCEDSHTCVSSLHTALLNACVYTTHPITRVLWQCTAADPNDGEQPDGHYKFSGRAVRWCADGRVR